MSADIFDLDNETFLALRNQKGEYSLWPDRLPVPAGWETAHGPADRPACIGYIEEHWSDLKPAHNRALESEG